MGGGLRGTAHRSPAPAPATLKTSPPAPVHLAAVRRSKRVTMVMDVTLPPRPPSVELAPRVTVREVTKEFVRRPAKGWTDPTPVPVVRFDHHCAVWEQ